MKYIFEGPEADRIRAEAPVPGRPLYTKGSSAELYDLGDTVLRLSSDSSSHCFLIVAGGDGLAVPRCIKDWGAVGVSDDSPDWDHYWLAEFEKMAPILEGSDEYDLISTWFQDLERLLNDEVGLMEREEIESLIVVLRN